MTPDAIAAIELEQQVLIWLEIARLRRDQRRRRVQQCSDPHGATAYAACRTRVPVEHAIGYAEFLRRRSA